MPETGEQAPAFALPNTAGGTTRLAEITDDGPAVLIFNRGVWCSYCAEQLLTFSALEYDLWRHLDADVVPIVGDPIPALVEMRDRFDLSLQLCYDEGLDVAQQYGGTEETDDHGEIATSATYVIDEAGTVRYEQIASDPSDRTYANFVRALIRDDYQVPFAD